MKAVSLILAVTLACPGIAGEQIDWKNLPEADLIARLRDPKHWNRAIAAQELSRRPSPRAFDDLARVLRDPEERPDVLLQAVWAIRNTGDPRGENVLHELLKHPDQRVRYPAAWALRPPFAGPRSVPPLLKLLQRQSPAETGTPDRMRAAESLGKIGDAAAAPALEPLLRDPDYRVRQAAIHALGQIGVPGSADRILAATIEREDTRLAVAQALLALRDRRCVQQLVELTAAKDDYAQRKARQMLVHMELSAEGDVTQWRLWYANAGDSWHQAFDAYAERHRPRRESQHKAFTEAAAGDDPAKQALPWLDLLIKRGGVPGDATCRMRLREIGRPAIPLVGDAYAKHRGQPYVLANLLAELGPKSLPWLVSQLTDFRNNNSAADAVAELMADEAVDSEILQLSRSKVADERLGAGRALARAPHTPARNEALAALLADTDERVRHATTGALRDGHKGPLVGDLKAAVLAVAADQTTPERRRVARLLAERHDDDDLLAAYLKLLEDPTRDVVISSLQYVHLPPKDAAIPALYRLVDHHEPLVRARATARLTRLGDRSQVGTVIALLDSDNTEEQRWALEAIADASITEARSHLYSWFERTRPPFPDVAFDAMDRIGDVSCCRVMLGLATDGDHRASQTRALRFLGRFGDASHIAALRPLTDDPNRSLARAAERALRSIEKREKTRAEAGEDIP